MVKTQIQIPDVLFQEAKRISRDREISFAEVVWRGIEYLVRIYPHKTDARKEWTLPTAHKLGEFRTTPTNCHRVSNREYKGFSRSRV